MNYRIEYDGRKISRWAIVLKIFEKKLTGESNFSIDVK